MLSPVHNPSRQALDFSTRLRQYSRVAKVDSYYHACFRVHVTCPISTRLRLQVDGSKRRKPKRSNYMDWSVLK